MLVVFLVCHASAANELSVRSVGLQQETHTFKADQYNFSLKEIKKECKDQESDYWSLVSVRMPGNIYAAQKAIKCLHEIHPENLRWHAQYLTDLVSDRDPLSAKAITRAESIFAEFAKLKASVEKDLISEEQKYNQFYINFLYAKALLRHQPALNLKIPTDVNAQKVEEARLANQLALDLHKKLKLTDISLLASLYKQDIEIKILQKQAYKDVIALVESDTELQKLSYKVFWSIYLDEGYAKKFFSEKKLLQFYEQAKSNNDERYTFRYALALWRDENNKAMQVIAKQKITKWLLNKTLQFNQANEYFNTLLATNNIEIAEKFVDEQMLELVIDGDYFDNNLVQQTGIVVHYMEFLNKEKIKERILKTDRFLANYKHGLSLSSIYERYNSFAKTSDIILKDNGLYYAFLEQARRHAVELGYYDLATTKSISLLGLMYKVGREDIAREYFEKAQKYAEKSKDKEILEHVENTRKAYQF